MRTFDVYTHSEKGSEAVKHGFSWPGFFFGGIWAIVKGLPGTGTILILALAGLQFIDYFARAEKDPFLGLFVVMSTIIVFIIVGVNGNNWRRKKLKEKGYVHVKTVEAKDPDTAIATDP